MRQIKYRLWNGSSMEVVSGITFHKDGSFHVNEEYPVNDRTMEEIFSGNRYFLMAFTGLLDRNLKEIYEGDIIRGFYYQTGEGKGFPKQLGAELELIVQWNEYVCGFEPFVLYEQPDHKDILGNYFDSDGCEIVGNIYQYGKT